MQYGLSAKSFSKVLGLGEISITRYENGSLQDEAQNNLILLAKEADNFSVLFEKNQAKLSVSEAARIRGLLGKARTITVWEQATSVHSSFPQQM
jgi:transcriptional regulator with XRE-family HTH domain